MTAKSMFLAAALAVATVCGGAQAATLTGQEVTCAIGGSLTCAPSPFTVTAGLPNPDAQVFVSGFAVLDIDFMDSRVEIAFNGEGSTSAISFGTPIPLTLSGLRPASGVETSLQNLSISNVLRLTASDFTLSGGVLTIDLSGSIWSAENNSSVSFEIIEAVPLPASALLLLGGLAGLTLARRRTSGV